jgi:type I restriction-modification system DNA methylase subunit
MGNSASGHLYTRAMEEAGFYHDSTPAEGVYSSEALKNACASRDARAIDRAFKYSAVLQADKLGVTDIYEWGGTPCIYFKRVDERLSEDKLTERIKGWHRATWSNGLARMLWVITPTEVRIFNGFKDAAGGKPTDVQLFHFVADKLADLREKSLTRRDIESGAFWDKERRIDRSGRVDQQLLRDLRATAEELKPAGLTWKQSHKLLLQVIFAEYLGARNLLKGVLSGVKAKNVSEALAKVATANQFFAAMHDTINADLFPRLASNEPDSRLTAKTLGVLRGLLSGTEPKTGQGRLWRYDFDVIPVELVSSIYEDFLHEGDNQETAKERSVHYTPLNLVDLVLSETFDDSVLVKAKVLDLSCGSGVFLVESFRRLVARRVAAGEKLTRRLIRDTLFNQLYGIDIEPEAIEIAAFSLLLTAIELEPDHCNGTPLKFARSLQGQNLYAADAFDEAANFNTQEPFVNRSIAVVVGNPPWTAPKGKGSKTPTKEPQRYIEYCAKRQPPFPLAHDNPPDAAFVRRAKDFAKDGARIGMILDATRFFSQEDDSRAVKKAVLTEFKPRVVYNLSVLHDQHLFPGAKEPALVLITENKPAGEDSKFVFASVERHPEFRKHGIIEIGPENVQRLPVSRAACEPDVLKIAAWGRPRDLALVQRMQKHPTLQGFLTQCGTDCYQGFIKGNGKNPVPRELWDKPLMTPAAMRSYAIDLALLGEFKVKRVEALRDPAIYRGPILLFGRALERRGSRIIAGYCPSSLVFNHSYNGIPLAGVGARAASFLNAVLNSSVATYCVFLTSATWGVERFVIQKSDLMRLPIPDLAANKGLVDRLCVFEAKAREAARHGPSVPRSLQSEIDNTVYDLYELTSNERVLVDDMLAFTIDFQRKHEASKGLLRCAPEELEPYAKHLISVIQPFFNTAKRYFLRAQAYEVPAQRPKSTEVSRSLRILKVSICESRPNGNGFEVVRRDDLDQLLSEIAKNIDEPLTRSLYTRRHLRIYSGNDIYIIKPDQRRFWSRSAGLNDGDAIIADHLGGRRD